MSSLTSHLLALHPAAYKSATTHPFLSQAGHRTLSHERLERWLAQDRLYAMHGYTRFLGALISRWPPPVDDVGSEDDRRHWKVFEVLSGAMQNITRELKFFDEVARTNGLDLNRRPVTQNSMSTVLDRIADTTQGYINFMVATGTTASPSEGLVLLWAMEKMYLDAWTFAASVSRPPASSSAGASRALDSLIPNWTSPEFQNFVDALAGLVDDLPEAKSLQSTGGAGAMEVKRLEQVWSACLHYEQLFWEAGVKWGEIEGDQ